MQNEQATPVSEDMRHLFARCKSVAHDTLQNEYLPIETRCRVRLDLSATYRLEALCDSAEAGFPVTKDPKEWASLAAGMGRLVDYYRRITGEANKGAA